MTLSEQAGVAAAPDSYRVRPGRAEEMALLPEIERLAARRFLDSAFAFVADLAPSTKVDYEAYQRDHLALVATDSADRPVAFAVARPVDGACYLAEIDVLPEHTGRGIGRRLIAGVENWAMAKGLRRVTLTTFRKVPWNAPFYTWLGFREMTDDEIGPELRAIRARQAEAGLRLRDRCCMCKDL